MDYDRDKLLDVLKDKNVLCRRHFYPGVHRIEPFKDCNYALPVTDRLCREVMQLPNGQNMNIVDVDKICATIREIHENR